ncbi:MAG: hypothetical protein ABI716_03305 [Candidatus Saccharibacteria bacterium]
MSLFQKVAGRLSSRRQIAIQGVEDGVLILPGHGYRLILEASSINFELKSEAEQDAMIDTYRAFLNGLACPLQIVIRVREMDMDAYLAAFAERVEAEPEAIYRQQAEDYREFVQGLITKNKILTRRFYIVVPYAGRVRPTAKNLLLVREQLDLSAAIVRKGLARLGVHSRQLGSLEVLDLFYEFYSPSSSKRQSLTEQTIQLFSEAVL